MSLNLKYFQQALEHLNKNPNGNGLTVSDEEVEENAITTQEGKIKLAQAMVAPIRRKLDYQGIARRILPLTPIVKKRKYVLCA
jgi:hypothetical protein